jgi:hypothetical protein
MGGVRSTSGRAVDARVLRGVSEVGGCEPCGLDSSGLGWALDVSLWNTAVNLQVY